MKRLCLLVVLFCFPLAAAAADAHLGSRAAVGTYKVASHVGKATAHVVTVASKAVGKGVWKACKFAV